ncbi:hypothetical protein HZH68_010521 [Vespula germanica]|uniref:Uncharacterized protein n=1 Tax=Vespula germanica TaxID=30212 RepID=A0A834JU97_VESGE|nr:hypothetical protein HZH68_010521 [Vespula germanica]
MAENSSSESNEKMPVEEEVKEELEAEGEEAAEECDAEESEEEDGNDNIKKRTKRNIITAPIFKIIDEIEYRLDTNGNWRPGEFCYVFPRKLFTREALIKITSYTSVLLAVQYKYERGMLLETDVSVDTLARTSLLSY